MGIPSYMVFNTDEGNVSSMKKAVTVAVTVVMVEVVSPLHLVRVCVCVCSVVFV